MDHVHLRDPARGGGLAGLSAHRLHANPPVPGRKSPEPDLPDQPGRDDETEPLPDEDDAERHRPGRDPHVCFGS